MLLTKQLIKTVNYKTVKNTPQRLNTLRCIFLIEYYLSCHNPFQCDMFYPFRTEKHNRFIKNNKRCQCNQERFNIKIEFSYIFYISEYNRHHKFKQPILIHCSNSKAQIGKRPVPAKNGSAAGMIFIPKSVHKRNIYGIECYNR